VQEFVSSLVRGRTVLDVGCVEHTVEREQVDTWLHGHLRRSAARVVGLDYNAAAVAELNRRGYQVIFGDAMEADLGERFDVVIAGEIIEHVENAGALIRNLKRHLRPGGQMVITTPNAFFGLHFVESLVASPYRRWNSEHVSWYCYFTLGSLLSRCGMEISSCWYFTRSRKTLKVIRPLRIKCPGVLASTLVVVANDASGASEAHPNLRVGPSC
jgi:2-polyprenyl-3-methyl-5-hydroxy-6-metoxy-1,4-benzoquinol methylase